MKNFFVKFKNQIKDFCKGIGIGVACIIPGVSGGTLAVLFNVFDKMINAINNIFKHFKDSFFTLLPIFLGVLVGVVGLIVPLDKAFEYIPFVIICLFVGFILGGLPALLPKIKRKPTVGGIISFLASLALVIGICFIPSIGDYNLSELNFVNCIVTLGMGVIASFALVVPGISGSMLLLILGFYQPLLDVLSSLLQFSNIGHDITIDLMFVICVVIGFLLVSKLIGFALAKFEYQTYMAIIGFIVGSIFSLFYQFYSPNGIEVMFPDIMSPGVHIGLSVVALIIGLALSLTIVIFSNKKEKKALEEASLESEKEDEIR